MARSHPAHFVVFDLLSAPGGESLLDRPPHERRSRLAWLLIDAPPNLVLCPQTTDVHEAREWLRTWPEVGVEGVVVKRCGGRYEPGRRGWRKIRAYRTVEAAVGRPGSAGTPRSFSSAATTPAGACATSAGHIC
ncbi:hypothetical protein [Polymorphospora rubra]|uniref:ATP-dependent DNA ligase n=1 Tax=Polymorphospora rubra TaxID=338584 RepID=UPI001BB348D1